MDKTYWAFISYSSKDRRWGKWLHRKLENYPIPAEFQGHQIFDGAVIEKNLRPVFRDRDELAGSSNLGAEILKALQASRFLVVLCSKNSAKSKWVNKEIEDFRALKKGNRILALILDGEPNSTNPKEECFPPALRYPLEPIAGDLRKEGDGKARGFLKILAGIAQVGFDDLYKRHERIQARKRLVAGITGFFLIILFAGMAAYAFQKQIQAERNRAETEHLKSEAIISLAKTRLREAKLTWLPRAEEATEKHRFPDGILYAARGLGFSTFGLEQLSPRRQQNIMAEYPHLFNLEKNQKLTRRFKDFIHNQPIKPMFPIWYSPLKGDLMLSVAFSPDGKRIAGGNKDTSVTIWSLKDGQTTAELRSHDGPAKSLFFSPDNTFLAGINHKNAVVWSLPSGKQTIINPGFEIKGAAFSPQGNTLALVGSSSTIYLCTPDTGQSKILTSEKNEFHAASFQGFNSVAFSQDNKTLACGGFNGSISLWNRSDGSVKLLPGMQTESTISSIAFNPDGKSIAAACGITVRIWDIISGMELTNLKYGYRIPNVHFSPDGSFLAYSDGAGSFIHLHDVKRNEELAVLNAGSEWLGNVSFGPDGRTLACAADQRVTIWDIYPGEKAKPSAGAIYSSNIVGYDPGGTFTLGDNETLPQSWSTPAMQLDLVAYIINEWYIFDENTGKYHANQSESGGFLNVQQWNHIGALHSTNAVK